MDPARSADDKRLYDLFRKVGMGEDGAYVAVREIRAMAGENIVSRVETQLERQSGETKELRAEVRNMYRTLGLLIAGIGVLLAVLQLVFRVMGD